MLIYLFGPDSYRRNKKLGEIVKTYQAKYRDIDLLAADLEDNPDDWLKVRDFLNQPSMFVESKVAVVKESGSVDEKEWRDLLRSHRETPKTFILVSDGRRPAKSFEFLLQEPVKTSSFEELTELKLAAFVKKEAAARGLVFSAQAWARFLSYLEAAPDRTWLAVNELEKISLARLAQPVALDDLQKAINWLPKTDVWRLTRELAVSGDTRTRLGSLEKLFLQKEDGARIFNSLVYQVRGSQISRLADYDVSVKSGGLEYEEALLDFVLGI